MDVMADLCVDHFFELNERLGDPRFLVRKAVERRLQELYPGRFSPLYSTVAFTCTPYEEAVRLDRAQRAVVDRILAVDGIEKRLQGPEMIALAARCIQELA
jgi:kynurenine 3-monooxygenase